MTRPRQVMRRRSPILEPLEGRTLMSGMAAPPPTLATIHDPSLVKTEGARYGVAKVASGVDYSPFGSKLDVYRPTGAPPPPGGFPAIIALPGGGWRKAKREDYGGAVASAFGPSGYVVVPADYLYASNSGGRSYPGNVSDVRRAVKWVRRHADRYDVNPDKVIVSGESAGAHLAALAGTLPDRGKVSGKPNAVVDFYGPSDLVHEWNTRGAARPYLITLLGGSLKGARKRYEAASPIDHVTPDDAPTYIIQGTADKIIPVAQSVAFDAALKDAGVAERLTLLPGITHGFRFRVGSRNLANEVMTFLDGVGVGTQK